MFCVKVFLCVVAMCNEYARDFYAIQELYNNYYE